MVLTNQLTIKVDTFDDDARVESLGLFNMTEIISSIYDWLWGYLTLEFP